MVKTHLLKVGDSIQAAGEVTVLKCGLHSQGGAKSTPAVALQVDDGQPEESAEDQQEEELQQADSSTALEQGAETSAEPGSSETPS